MFGWIELLGEAMVAKSDARLLTSQRVNIRCFSLSRGLMTSRITFDISRRHQPHLVEEFADSPSQ
jgi:hypothetical protein